MATDYLGLMVYLTLSVNAYGSGFNRKPRYGYVWKVKDGAKAGYRSNVNITKLRQNPKVIHSSRSSRRRRKCMRIIWRWLTVVDNSDCEDLALGCGVGSQDSYLILT